MTARPATALRLGLHLLLAACLLLQATVAFALGTTMATAATDAPSAAAGTSVEGSDHAPSAHASADAVPPCHAAMVATAAVDHPQTQAAHACCSGDGGLCEWVCAGAPPLAVARFAMVLPTAIVAPAPTIAVAAPQWPVSTPLRPPIA